MSAVGRNISTALLDEWRSLRLSSITVGNGVRFLSEHWCEGRHAERIPYLSDK
jgi:hypothetical protein